MRKLLLATAAGGALLAGGAASAADLSVAPAPAPYVAPVAVAYTWSGGYLGLNAGGIWGRHDFDPVNATLIAGPLGGECALPSIGSSCGFSLRTDRDSSFIGGIHFGDRWQFGQFVLGVEQDAQWTDVKTGFVLGANAPFAGGPFGAGDAFQAKLKYLGNTRAQLGVAFDRVLVYAAGGLATGVMDVSAAYVARPGGPLGFASPGSFVTDQNKFHVGFTVGGGIDYAVTNNVSIGVEYRYTELNSETYNLGGFSFGTSGRVYTSSADVGLKSHEVLGRLNIKTEPLLAIFGIR